MNISWYEPIRNGVRRPVELRWLNLCQFWFWICYLYTMYCNIYLICKSHGICCAKQKCLMWHYQTCRSFLNHLISCQSTPMVKSCIGRCLIWKILPLIIKVNWSSANFFQESSKLKESCLHVIWNAHTAFLLCGADNFIKYTWICKK